MAGFKDNIILHSKTERRRLFDEHGLWAEFLKLRTESRKYGVASTASDMYAQGIVCGKIFGEAVFASSHKPAYDNFLKGKAQHVQAMEHYQKTGQPLPGRTRATRGGRISKEMQQIAGLNKDGTKRVDKKAKKLPPTESKPNPGIAGDCSFLDEFGGVVPARSAPDKKAKAAEPILADVLGGIVRDEGGNVVFGGVSASARANVIFAFDALARAQLGEVIGTDQFPSPASWMLFRDAYTSPLEKDDLKKMYAKMIDKNSDDDDGSMTAGENLGLELDKIMNFERTVDHSVISG